MQAIRPGPASTGPPQRRGRAETQREEARNNLLQSMRRHSGARPAVLAIPDQEASTDLRRPAPLSAGAACPGTPPVPDEVGVEQFNATRCLGRTWNNGLGAQCQARRPTGQDFCKVHSKNSKHGRVDEAPPVSMRVAGPDFAAPRPKAFPPSRKLASSSSAQPRQEVSRVPHQFDPE